MNAPEYCAECGFDKMELVGEVKNTRSYKCKECFAEQIRYIDDSECEHEYNAKSNNHCIHCGAEK